MTGGEATGNANLVSVKKGLCVAEMLNAVGRQAIREWL